ncbi:MAG: glucosyl transferase [Ignavibacteriales bacterium CG18_big_fil_WC_8_21_14_2_50_31_20]|nr:MAG: glucosyl transferase [Ignavibacteriales bacterium CG18_big_fil_WC_8_21_14_2_50_31_20]
MMFKNLMMFLIVLLIIVMGTSCETTEHQNKVKILLEAEDASCTEAWLNLKIESIALPIEITLFQGDSLLFTTNINSSDTTLFVENLLPNQNYSFYSTMSPFSHSILKSNVASVTTMDTTSHNFSWETFEFGEQSNSHFKDVAIINENNIWAVGEIHTAETDQFDSNGVWVQPYNAVHWDGVKWELKRILYENNFWTINTIIAFSEDDIWFDVFVHWNGTKFNNEPIPNILMGWRSNSIWGTSSEDFYVVGNGGNIAHYNGSKWTKIESGTELNINDIWGGGENNKNTIYLMAAELFTDRNSELHKINNNESTLVNNTDLGKSTLSVWGYGKKLYVAGSILYLSYNGGKEFVDIGIGVKERGLFSIRGLSYNDIFITGVDFQLAHFNGLSWRKHNLNVNANGEFYKVMQQNNIACAVGINNSNRKAIIAIGRR